MDEKQLQQPRNVPRRPTIWPIVLCIPIQCVTLIPVALGILLGLHLAAGPLSWETEEPAIECPAALPLDPIHRHPLLRNDTRLKAAEKELSEVLLDKLGDTDSAVIVVVHDGQTLLEWSHGRIRSNVSAEDDNRKVGADTIWRVASITKVFVYLPLANIVGVHRPRSISAAE